MAATAAPPRTRGPAYRLVTRRLVVRCWDPRDAPLLHEAIGESAAHLAPWIPWMAKEPLSLDDRIEALRRFRAGFDLGQDLVYGIFDRAEARVLGGTGQHPRVGPRATELGYWIRAGAVRQGFAVEAVAAVTRAAFEIDGLDRVEIHCDPRNVASAAVAARLGFRHEVTRRKALLDNAGAWHERMIWTMLPEELAASPAAALEVEAYDAAGRRLG